MKLLCLFLRKKISLEEIHQHRWIIYNDEDNLMLAYRKLSEHIIQVDDISTIIELVKEGIGIAVVPNHVLGDQSELFVQKFTRGDKR